ncbi:MAG: hypothetical protein DI570_07245 [Phenylobacterium zucineum]|nr:MAG: hypothetical protein DI570_07245 [Phenylobacterium zucineum]
MTRTLMIAGLMLAAGLAGCGKVGPLERPGPMFGGPRPAAEADKPDRVDTTRPVDTVDPRDRDRSTDPTPQRANPIPGSGQNPAGAGPRTAFPDPYMNPRR